MNNMKKDLRTIKMTKTILLIASVVVAVCEILQPILFQKEINIDHILGAIVIMGLGALSECAQLIYNRLNDIEMLCNRESSDKNPD